MDIHTYKLNKVVDEEKAKSNDNVDARITRIIIHFGEQHTEQHTHMFGLSYVEPPKLERYVSHLGLVPLCGCHHENSRH